MRPRHTADLLQHLQRSPGWSRAETQAHSQAGLLRALVVLPQVSLTLFARGSQRQQNLCTLLPPSSPPTIPSSPQARRAPEPLLPATKALTAPCEDFRENLLTDCTGGPELRASFRSSTTCTFTELTSIPLTSLVIRGEHLSPFEPQFSHL